VSSFYDDVRYALRSLRSARLTVAVLVSSFAVGTGANAVLYRAMDSLIFRQPPGVVDPHRLVSVFTSSFNGNTFGLSSHPDFVSLRPAMPALATAAVFDDSLVDAVRLETIVRRARIVAAGPDFFDVLGMQPLLGQLSWATQSRSGQPAVISADLWTAYGEITDIVGRRIRVGDREYAVAAVLPRGFRGIRLDRPCDVWIPLDVDSRRARGDRRLSILGRLAPNADVETAQRQALDVATHLAQAYPETNRGTRTAAGEPRRITVTEYARVDPDSTRQFALLGAIVFGASCMLLVSACVNAGLMLLSRSAARRRELAVKVALGASRGTLVRQALVESLAISIGGAVLGLLLAYWTSHIVPSFLATEEAAAFDPRLDVTTAAATTVFAFVAGAVFTIGPARHATSAVDIEVLRADAGGVSAAASTGTFRSLVVTGQVALSTMLVILAGLLVRAVSTTLNGTTGVQEEAVAVANTKAPNAETKKVVDWITFQNAALDSARHMAGAKAAAWVMTLPARRSPNERVEIESAPGLRETAEVETNIVSPAYFQTMGVPLVEGRAFGDNDGGLAPPVAIVNDVLARRYFGPGATGRSFRLSDGTSVEIVGVAAAMKYRLFQEGPDPTVYFPMSQRSNAVMHMVVRTANDARAAVQPLRDLLLSSGEGARVEWAMTFKDYLSRALLIDRVLTTVVGACAILALLLAVLGVNGVMADAVRRRTPEIGLRFALGAQRRAVIALVFGHGLYLTAAGALTGTVAAVTVARMARRVVQDMPPVDLVSVAIVPLVMVLIALGGALLPAWRALSISPTVALRAE
jgi:putative ABC transport system permease protein